MDSEEFNLPIWPWGVAMALLQAPFFAFGTLSWIYVGFLWSISWFAFGIVFVIFPMWATKLSLRRDGIVLHHFNRLSWTDVTGARVRRFLGLPYLQVRRKRGIPYWIPMFLVGRRPLREALVDAAPVGNPVRECLEEAH